MTFTPSFPEESTAFSICFVCTGNICRSPMAEVVLRALAEKAGLGAALVVSSAGTGDWHVGEAADRRTLEALDKMGYDGSHHRARQFESEWFDALDLVVVLDRGQERILRNSTASERDRAKVVRLLTFAPQYSTTGDVPDPYYSDAGMFDAVLAMVQAACEGLFAQIEPALRSAASSERSDRRLSAVLAGIQSATAAITTAAAAAPQTETPSEPAASSVHNPETGDTPR